MIIDLFGQLLMARVVQHLEKQRLLGDRRPREALNSC